MDLGISQIFPVVEQSQIGDARRRAEVLAREIGFNDVQAGNLAIVVTELGTNLLKHTHAGGDIILQIVRDSDAYAIELIATNSGSGSSASEAWLKDGFSTAATLGAGLGAVNRLSQRFDLFSASDFGTTISACFRHKTKETPRFDVAAVCRALPTETACGDRWLARQDDGRSVICVVDGLGHGPDAARAAAIAVDIFAAQPLVSSPQEIVSAIHLALRGTRGAAVAVATIDRVKATVTYCGLGNISGALISSDDRKHLLSDNGTAGYEARKIRQWSFPWRNNAVLVMYSDGISARCLHPHYDGLWKHSAATIAGTLYRDHNKSIDDATVAVLREAR